MLKARSRRGRLRVFGILEEMRLGSGLLPLRCCLSFAGRQNGFWLCVRETMRRTLQHRLLALASPGGDQSRVVRWYWPRWSLAVSFQSRLVRFQRRGFERTVTRVRSRTQTVYPVRYVSNVMLCCSARSAISCLEIGTARAFHRRL